VFGPVKRLDPIVCRSHPGIPGERLTDTSERLCEPHLRAVFGRSVRTALRCIRHRSPGTARDASDKRLDQAFDWAKHNTPVDSLFALDPRYMELPGEDYHGFRALAERSVLADDLKDQGW